jgi:DNA-directed RNA polymerase subunit RPC12/RpoP
MRMNKPNASESYKCYPCDKDLLHTEVTDDWKCTACGEPVAIKMEIDGNMQSCCKVMPDELQIDSLMYLRGVGNFIVLAINKVENGYRIALKGHGVKKVNENDFLITIDGIWS